MVYGTHKARDPRCNCWLGSCCLGLGAWSWRRKLLTAPLEGVLDHICTDDDLVCSRSGSEAGRKGCRGCRGASKPADRLGRQVALAAGTAVEAGLEVKIARKKCARPLPCPARHGPKGHGGGYQVLAPTEKSLGNFCW